ncbi:hypothetical protein [Viridibacillus arvi]|uniref:hypothetical protein n=1 Tax=Viridibacillus arvi TaxID=263475 RepID=UPI0034CEA601
MKKTVKAPTEYLLEQKIQEQRKRFWEQEGRVFYDEHYRGGLYCALLVREDDSTRC